MVYLFYHIKGAFVYCPFLTDLCRDGLGSFFEKKVEKVLKKGLTKRKKCAVDFISTLIKSTLVNRGKSAIDKEREDELHTKKD